MIKHMGGCACGAIRFEARGDPLRVGLCHCLDCRKRTGAPYFATVFYHVGQVSISGERRTDGGWSFCPKCGSTVHAQTDTDIELALGCFDEPRRFEPGYELWTIRREPWLAPVAGAKQYERDRD
ncbi:MAG: GFA family protein [Pseudomonadota bacterium]